MMAGRPLRKLPPVPDFPRRVRKALAMRERTQKELAADLGITENTLSNIMRGHTTDPGISLVYAIANNLDVSADYLFGYREDMERR